MRQQPWYFYHPIGIALDRDENVYIVDGFNHRIQKFTKDGQLITKWGSEGSGDGQFLTPEGIAVDMDGFVYVADSHNRRIQKFTPSGEFIVRWGGSGYGDGAFNTPAGIAVNDFREVYVTDSGRGNVQRFTSDGKFLSRWGVYGTGEGQFDWPESIAIDKHGDVYVADSSNHRIQKFTSDGMFLLEWGRQGMEDGYFYSPQGIAVGPDGNLYVTERVNNRIQQFTPDGEFLKAWGTGGTGEGKFDWLQGIAGDSVGNLYVADAGNNRIQKLTSDGQFISAWESEGSRPGVFRYPGGIVADGEGNVYVVDRGNDRIQRFDSDGKFIEAWGTSGEGPGEFDSPSGIEVDEVGDVYVVDSRNHRVQKFSGDGRFVATWGTEGTGDGEFDWPQGIAVSKDGFVYVADYRNHRIQKFDRNGEFVQKWGSLGAGDGAFDLPIGVAVDSARNVYVTDLKNNRIQKFNSEGVFLLQWGAAGEGDGEFRWPSGIDIDSNGRIFAVDSLNHRIQMFSGDGAFYRSFGEFGSDPGDFNEPADVDIGDDGRLYVSEYKNHRVQVFRMVATDRRSVHGGDMAANQSKALIVAGGGPHAGNQLWDATQMCANFAYRALTHQGFDRNSIQYLTANGQLDLNNNGEPDDVDGSATRENVVNAIDDWAKDADELVVYMVDHGGPETFRLGGSKTFAAEDLKDALDVLQESNGCRVIVVLDACESGSFITALSPPPGVERIVISSTSPEESAYFISQGSLSFSNYFWTHVFNGKSVLASFEGARVAVMETTAHQHPMLDDNGDGWSNDVDGFLAEAVFIGNGNPIPGDAPLIGEVVPGQDVFESNTAFLWADSVTDADGVARVWATIRPPGYKSGNSTDAVQELPSVELLPAGEHRYEVEYDRFDAPGVYEIAIHARDRNGNTSQPKTTRVRVDAPLRHRAVILALGDPTAADWPAVETNAALCYESLLFQGYGEDDIYFFSPVSFAGGVDEAPALLHFYSKLKEWADEDTLDLVFYVINGSEGQGIRISPEEILEPEALVGWLDDLQNVMPGPATVVCDGHGCGEFILELHGNADYERILIGAAALGDKARFLARGQISFSHFFWNQIANGADVYSAFTAAKNSIGYASGQIPILDDNGNRVANERTDGQLARKIVLGAGIQLAGNAPAIGAVPPAVTLHGAHQATIRVGDIAAVGNIQHVWAVVAPPVDGSISAIIDPSVPQTIDLFETSDGYEAEYDGFTVYGDYRISVYAEDDAETVSLPASFTIRQEVAPDAFEPDDGFENARAVHLSNPSVEETFEGLRPQSHNFHAAGDEDWAAFYALAEQSYEIRTDSPGARCDTAITLFDRDGQTVIASRDDWRDGIEGHGELLSWKCPSDGVYFILISQHDASVFGENTGYDLNVYIPVQGVPGLIVGRVTDEASGEGIENAELVSGAREGAALTDSNGYFVMVLPSGGYVIGIEAENYEETEKQNVFVYPEGQVSCQFELTKMNQPPTVDIPCFSYVVLPGATVRIDAFMSDPDDGIESFVFEQISGIRVDIGDPLVWNDWIAYQFQAPNFEGLLMTFRLTVKDYGGLTDSDEILVRVANTNGVGMLIGRVIDSQGTGISNATLHSDIGDVSGETGPYGFFAINLPAGIHEITLEAEGYQTTKADDVVITDTGNTELNFTMIRTEAFPPIADAGPDQTIRSGAVFVLDGSQSFDPDGEIVGYLWEQNDGPVVTISDPSTVSASFLAPDVSEPTILSISLTVQDGDGLSSTDLISVRISPYDFLADAGSDQMVEEGKTVTLQGVESYGNEIEYEWVQTHGPKVALSNPNSAEPTFVSPPVDVDEAVISFRLTVTDADGNMSSDDMCVKINDNGIDGFPGDVLPIKTATGKGVGVKIIKGGALISVYAKPSSEIADTANRPWNLIYGLLDVQIRTGTGKTALLELHFPEPAVYEGRNYRGFSHSSETGWREMKTGFYEGRDVATLLLQDGLDGDADRSENGVIVSRIGVGIRYTDGIKQDDDSGNDGGCFIDSTIFP